MVPACLQCGKSTKQFRSQLSTTVKRHNKIAHSHFRLLAVRRCKALAAYEMFVYATHVAALTCRLPNLHWQTQIDFISNSRLICWCRDGRDEYTGCWSITGCCRSCLVNAALNQVRQLIPLCDKWYRPSSTRSVFPRVLTETRGEVNEQG